MLIASLSAAEDTNRTFRLKIGDNLLIIDSIINLSAGFPIKNIRRNIHYQEEKVDYQFRLEFVKIKCIPKNILVNTNNFELTD
jgi:hypothetical protein